MNCDSAGDVLDRAVEVRLADEDRGDVVPDDLRRRWREAVDDRASISIDRAPAARTSWRASPALCGCRLSDTRNFVFFVWVCASQPRGGDGARALVDARVADRQAGQLGDRRLVLEHHLQPALGDLGLVGRVGREELRTATGSSRSARARSGRTSRRRGTRSRPRRRRSWRPGRGGGRRPPARACRAAMSRGRSRRTPSGTSAKRSSIDSTPMAASISARSVSVADV